MGLPKGFHHGRDFQVLASCVYCDRAIPPTKENEFQFNEDPKRYICKACRKKYTKSDHVTFHNCAICGMSTPICMLQVVGGVLKCNGCYILSGDVNATFVNRIAIFSKKMLEKFDRVRHKHYGHDDVIQMSSGEYDMLGDMKGRLIGEYDEWREATTYDEEMKECVDVANAAFLRYWQIYDILRGDVDESRKRYFGNLQFAGWQSFEFGSDWKEGRVQ